MLADARATGEEPALIDQMVVSLASVIYLCGLVLVLAGAETPVQPPSAASSTPLAPASAATGAAPVGGASMEISMATPLARHRATFDLSAGSGVEFKYRLDQGAGMTYVWVASGTVKVEFHGEPDGARPGYADTYRLSEAREGRGTFVAPTRGIHGWYWENLGQSPVKVTLESSGFYTAAIEFTSKGPVERPISR